MGKIFNQLDELDIQELEQANDLADDEYWYNTWLHDSRAIKVYN
jgi:hypothetical protein